MIADSVIRFALHSKNIWTKARRCDLRGATFYNAFAFNGVWADVIRDESGSITGSKGGSSPSHIAAIGVSLASPCPLLARPSRRNLKSEAKNVNPLIDGF